MAMHENGTVMNVVKKPRRVLSEGLVLVKGADVGDLEGCRVHGAVRSRSYSRSIT